MGKAEGLFYKSRRQMRGQFPFAASLVLSVLSTYLLMDPYLHYIWASGPPHGQGEFPPDYPPHYPPAVHSGTSPMPPPQLSIQPSNNLANPPGGSHGSMGVGFYLPPLPGYVPPVPHYPALAQLTPPVQPAAPPSPSTPPPPVRNAPVSPLAPLTAGLADNVHPLAGEVRLRNFSFSYQVWLQLNKLNKRKKREWENMKGRNFHLPQGSSLSNVDLHGFKKMIAAECRHKGHPCTNTILQADRDGQLTWHFHVNRSLDFRRVDNVEVNNDEGFGRWIDAALLAGQRPLGVRISHLHPETVAEQLKMSSAVLHSLKRSNRNFIPSSDGALGDDEASIGDASDSDDTLEDDPAQALTTMISDIRELLCAGRLNNGEVPKWIDPRDPRHVITMTPAHLKVWAEDVIAKVPGVTIVNPPLNRREFKSTKRAAGLLGALEDNNAAAEPQPKQAKSALAGLSAHETEALALEAEAPMAEFLNFAGIRAESLVQSTMAQFDKLGIDTWFVLKSPDSREELRSVGMSFGTAQKLTMAAQAFETVLANRILCQTASGSGTS